MSVTPAAWDRVSGSSMHLPRVIVSQLKRRGARLRQQHFASPALILCGCQMLSCADGFHSAPQDDIIAVEPAQAAPVPTIEDKCAPIGGQLLCICPNGVDTGQRTCQPAAALPTQGTLTPCLPCDAKPITAGTSASASGAGMTSDGPQQGAAGNAAADAGSASASAGGSAARALNGMAGSAGTAVAVPSAGAPSRTAQGNPLGRAANPLAPASGTDCECSQPCFPFGILACCRMDGSCGCSWAPGAYCL